MVTIFFSPFQYTCKNAYLKKKVIIIKKKKYFLVTLKLAYRPKLRFSFTVSNIATSKVDLENREVLTYPINVSPKQVIEKHKHKT